MLTGSMVSEVGAAITNDIGSILPVCITIMAGLLGITFLPKLVKKFAKG